MIYYLLLNGPPASGKTTLARCALREFKRLGIRAEVESIANPMKQFSASLLGQPYSTIDKGKKLSYANGVTVRQFLINLSEDYLRKTYGTSFFGHALIDRWRITDYDTKPTILVIDDCGFQDEILPLPRDRVLLVRVLRPNFTYHGDSRDYLPNPDRRLSNDGDLQAAESKIEEIVRDFITKFKLNSGRLSNG